MMFQNGLPGGLNEQLAMRQQAVDRRNALFANGAIDQQTLMNGNGISPAWDAFLQTLNGKKVSGGLGLPTDNYGVHRNPALNGLTAANPVMGGPFAANQSQFKISPVKSIRQNPNPGPNYGG